MNATPAARKKLMLASKAAAGGSAPVPQQVKILIVDDDPRNIVVLQTVLEELGQNVVPAVSGEEALKCLLNDDFAVILLDIQMPGMDGFETATYIQQRERSSRTPIIFLTALSDPQFIHRGYLAGAVDYMSKPIEPDILRSKVSVFVELFRKTDEVRRQGELLNELEQREHERQFEDERRRTDLELQRVREDGLQREKENEQRSAAELAHKAEELSRINEQLQSIAQAMTLFLEASDWESTAELLVVSACAQTASEDGHLVAMNGERLRPVGGGIAWPDAAYRALLGEGGAGMCNDTDADPRWQDLAEVGVKTFAWMPVSTAKGVLGGIAVANRAGGYSERDLEPLRLLSHTAGILLDSHQRQSRETDLQAQLRQAQKMEAIGNLAGGVAHDFNNLLTVIRGFSGLMLESLPEGDENRESAEAIAQAADRAAGLTQQLLAFSRKQVLQLRVVDLNEVLRNVEKLLKRVIGEHIELLTELDPDLLPVRVDPAQMEQIVMNLAINARDAMPGGGRLTIRTVNIASSLGPSANGADLTVPHVMLDVFDTGSGMDEATRTRVFEPFFTTKERGKGTGLGLATVYGIVKQSGGQIRVESAPGKGARFCIQLPCADMPVTVVVPVQVVASSTPCSETILLVEDEPAVRALARTLLVRAGYQVLEAADGVLAMEVVESYEEHIDLLLTDVVMPNMNGRDLGLRAASLRPGMAILYMSGYMDDTLRDFGVHQDAQHLLHKPFTSDQLLHRIRHLLDRPDSRPRSASKA